MKQTMTAPCKFKDITLPSHGLYNSFIGTELDSALENYTYNSDKQFAIDEWINTSDAFHRASRKVNDRMLLEYGAFFIDWLNEQYSCNIKAHDFEYVPMNMRNYGDTLHAMIDTDSLPTLDTLAHDIDGLHDKLKALAVKCLSSYSGFISFYDSDITPLLDKPYAVWGDAYIMVLIELMLDDTGYDIGDVEQAYIEDLNSNSTIIDYLFDALDHHSCELLNDLLSE